MLKKPIFFVLGSFVIYLALGLSTLTNFLTADEHFWLPNYGTERLQDYWRAVSEGKWKNTRINDKPGVTLAYFSGVGLLFVQDEIATQIVSNDKVAIVFDPEKTKTINFALRFPIFLFTGLFIFYLYWILRKITSDDWIASWAAILMFLSPVLLGIDQIVNPDTLFWGFGTATLFTFFAYLKFRTRRYVLLTTLFFGLTLASKYVGVIFFPFFIMMLFMDYLFRLDEHRAS